MQRGVWHCTLASAAWQHHICRGHGVQASGSILCHPRCCQIDASQPDERLNGIVSSMMSSTDSASFAGANIARRPLVSLHRAGAYRTLLCRCALTYPGSRAAASLTHGLQSRALSIGLPDNPPLEQVIREYVADFWTPTMIVAKL